MHKHLCLIVPCFNEASRLQVADFRTFLAAASTTLILFVDDGSTDNTVAVLERIRLGNESSCGILRATTNSGKGEAVRRGMLHALANFNPEIIGFWDADLATPLDAVPRLLGILDQRPAIAMVFGARIKLLGRHVHRSSVRHYLGRVFATLASNLLRLEIYDTQNGAKLFRVGPETSRIFAEPFLSKWVFDVEILARYLVLYCHDGHRLAQVIYEYPLEVWTDVAGSKVRPRHFFIAACDIARIYWKYLAPQTR